jgi:WD40 repeat protein
MEGVFQPKLSEKMAINPLKRIMVLKTKQSLETGHFDVLINNTNQTAEFVGETCISKWDIASGQLLNQKRCYLPKGLYPDSVRFHKQLENVVIISRFCHNKHCEEDYVKDSTVWKSDGGKSYFHCIRDGKCFNQVPCHTGEVWDIVEMEDGRFVTASHDSSLKTWDGTTFELVTDHKQRVQEYCTSSIHCLKMLPNGHLISGDYTGGLNVWQYPGMDRIKGANLGRLIWGMDIFEDKVAVCGGGGICAIYSTKLDFIKSWRAHSDMVRTCCFLRNGYLMTGGYDDMLRVWNVDTMECIHSMHHVSLKPRFVRCMWNGWVVVGGWSNEIDIYDTTMYAGRLHFYNGFTGDNLSGTANVEFHFDSKGILDK